MLRHTTPGNADLARDEAQNNAKIKVAIYQDDILIKAILCSGHENVVNNCLLVCHLLASDTYSESLHILRSGLARSGLQYRVWLQGLHRFND